MHPPKKNLTPNGVNRAELWDQSRNLTLLVEPWLVHQALEQSELRLLLYRLLVGLLQHAARLLLAAHRPAETRSVQGYAPVHRP